MESLAERLIDVGRKIKDHSSRKPYHPDFVYLRELGEYCNARLFQSSDSKEKLICFYLSRMVDSFFSNFGGDTPYDEEIQSARIDFYSALSDGIIKLGDKIKIGDLNSSCELLSTITDKYISIIKYLNKV